MLCMSLLLKPHSQHSITCSSIHGNREAPTEFPTSEPTLNPTTWVIVFVNVHVIISFFVYLLSKISFASIIFTSTNKHIIIQRTSNWVSNGTSNGDANRNANNVSPKMPVSFFVVSSSHILRFYFFDNDSDAPTDVPTSYPTELPTDIPTALVSYNALIMRLYTLHFLRHLTHRKFQPNVL